MTVVVHGGDSEQEHANPALHRGALRRRASPGGAGGPLLERESVPYKAVDGIVDALSRHLSTLPEPELWRCCRQRGLVGQVFPVMRRIEAVAKAPRPEPGALDPLGAPRAYALRRMCSPRLAERCPLVLGHEQSAVTAWRARRRDAPAERAAPLVVTAVRAALASERRAAEARGEAVAMRGVDEVGPASAFTATCAASQSRPCSRATRARWWTRCCARRREHGVRPRWPPRRAGAPLLIERAGAPSPPARRARGPAAAHRGAAIAHRAARPRRARAARAVRGGGRAAGSETAAAAAEIDFAELARRIAVLRTGNLLRTAGARGTNTKSRPIATACAKRRCSGSTPPASGRAHAPRAGARGLAHPPNPRRCTPSTARRGSSDEAATYARSQPRARPPTRSRSIAALQLALKDGGRRRVRTARASRASSATRWPTRVEAPEAAAAYLAAASALGPAEALDLRRRAANQLLRSGHINEAMATLAWSFRPSDEHAQLRARRARPPPLAAPVRLRGLSFFRARRRHHHPRN